VSPTTLDQIKTEIEAGVVEEEDLRGLMADAAEAEAKAAKENPPSAEPPADAKGAVPAPKVKAPKAPDPGGQKK
jgi:hypothetical protein